MNKVLSVILVVGGALGAAACGDNSKTCGENTMLVDGRCVGTGGPPMCTDGTILDQSTNSCVIDPNACQGGTVLIDNKCQDPTAGLNIDVTEGAEPNGAGFIEDSQMPAGILNLKPVGESLIVKGTFNPFRDADGDGQRDADYDLYFLEVNEPTLLDVTVDGVNGAMGAFVVIAASQTNPVNNAASGWIRYGMNVTGDMSKRQVFLPAAGDYAIVFADTRSMYLDSSSPPAAGFGGAAGGPDAEYYATIKRIEIPTPTPITLNGGDAVVSDTLGSELKFYSAPMGTGFNQTVLTMQTANPSVVLMRNGNYKDSADQYLEAGLFGSTLVPADLLVLGYDTADTAMIVADFTYNYGPDPDPFELLVVTSDATALSRTGETVSQPVFSDAPGSFFDFNVFYYDVTSANEIAGLDIEWNAPVDGLLIDESFFITARFTYGTSGFTGQTWGDFTGLVRHRTPGRYYFVVYNPNGDPSTDDVEVTSTISTVPAVAVTKGTPLTDQAINTQFGANPFSYTAGKATDPWQLFNASGTGTGDIELRFYNASTAYGRLSPLAASATPLEDATPIFEDLFAEDGGAPTGRILIDDPSDTYLVIARTELATETSTLELDFARRDFVDLGTIAGGGTTMQPDQQLGGTVEIQRYLVRTNAGNGFEITVEPGSDAIDTQIKTVNATEATVATFNDADPHADDIAQVMVSGGGWLAFTVTPVGTVATDETFNLTVGAIEPATYTITDGTTTYSDACAGGSVVTLVDDGDGWGGADEGLTAPINPPAGFRFFGFAAPAFRVSSNGFLTFSPISKAAFSNQNIPATGAPNGVVAAYWDDLDFVEVCQKTVGSKLIIQWTGVTLSGSFEVQAQAILDGATSTIEFVYGPDHEPTGNSATIGVEDTLGSTAYKVGYNQADVIAPGTSKLLTPM